MQIPARSFVVRLPLFLIAFVILASQTTWAQSPTRAVTGRVVDPLGGRVSGAAVSLLRDGTRVASAFTDARGEFTFPDVAEGRYQVEGSATGFSMQRLPPFFVGAGGRDDVEIVLSIGPFVQQTVVSAAAAALPQAQVGASVTVIDSRDLDATARPDLFEAFRAVPGASVVQTGARGGATSLFLRGGNSGFAKVIVDGVPVNEIGGAFNFGDVQTTGVERIEVLRGPNSVLYGADALTGVVTLTTARGRSRRPEVTYATEGGTLGTLRQVTSFAGAVKRLEYYSAYSRIGTDNQLPNSQFTNDTYAGRFGVTVGRATELGVVVRHNASDQGVPNAVSYFGIADDSTQRTRATIVSMSARSRITSALTSEIRVSSVEQSLALSNPTPSGEPFDPFGYGANYLGDVVTIRGANGTTATGRAVLDFGGNYPQRYDSESRRRSLHATVDYRMRPSFSLAGGFRFDAERGISDSGLQSSASRRDAGAFVEVRGVLGRVFLNAGAGVDHHTVFQTTVVPRLSVATYLRTAAPAASWGETKLTFNAGKGVKAPSLLQELSSLYSLVQAAPLAALQVSSLRPERSTGIDMGIEQAAAGGRLRLTATWFDNRFSDLIEFVGATWLARLGVSDDAVAAASFGAYMNSQSYRARGLEASVNAALAPSLHVAGSYTYLSTRVTQSFDSSALVPAINSQYPDQPIGAYSPLVGGRPFRRPVHAGSVAVTYEAGRLRAVGRASMSGRYDDSTFLSDPNFGNSLLLPNRDLGAAYRKVDASATYAISARVTAYAAVENLLNARYEAASGYPALRRTARGGLKVGFGGDRPAASPARQD